ncbi:NAC domain-containing protein 104-like isoform X1 [Malus domestica]|uniref:NAC domain-containing protein 104-like isoform X1 n=1 Tax=Malus domestica TaxID=3750 RepID=UPI0010AA8CB7|nr:NAC domain-containing protein 104-like isoform X1 [Malus domestica]
MGDNQFKLPPGFRFDPTDEELVVHFLQRKATLLPFHPDVIPDLHLYPYDPWELNGKALSEGKQWYFYSRKAQNRVTSNGYWKTLGIEEPIFSSSSSNSTSKVGMKRYLTFYVGEAPNSGIKTNWIMHEYRLSSSASDCASSSTTTTTTTRSSKRRGQPKTVSNACVATHEYSGYILCRVYERDEEEDDDDDGTELSCLDEVFLSLDDLDEISLPN